MTRGATSRFIRAMWEISQGRPGFGLALSIVAGLTEGLSLMLLIPLVALASPETFDGSFEIPVIGPWLAGLDLELGWLLAIFVLLVLLQALLVRWKAIYNQRILTLAAEDLRTSLFAAMSMSRWETISTIRTADLNHSLSSDVDRIVGAFLALLNLAQALFMLALYATLALFVSWQMAIFAVALGGGLFLLLYPIRKRATGHGTDLVALYQHQNATILEFIAGIRVAKLFNAEAHEVERYQHSLVQLRERMLSFASFSTIGTVAYQVGTAVVAAAFVWFSITVFDLDLPRLALLLVIFARLAPRFSNLQENVQNYLSEVPAFDNYLSVKEKFDLNREPSAEGPDAGLELTRNIRLEEVSFMHEAASKPAIEGVSLDIFAGEVTALIGSSGSGKSTLADIVQGLIRPKSGTLYVDDVPIDDQNRRSWRRSIASVPQDAFLFNDTIAANLRLAKRDATDKELWAALESANIAELIDNLPEGLETIAGERGGRFSGGEKQRLALARAILRQPSLLILDEATSALDWENQQLVAAALSGLRGRTTILTIAHRPSLIAIADRVVTLANGRVVETGNYAELAADPNTAVAKLLAAEGATPA